MYIDNEIFFSHKKNETMPFAATWTDLEIIILSEVRDRKANILWYHLYMESKKKKNTNEVIYKIRLTDIENKLIVTKGDSQESGKKLELGD